MVHIPTGGLVAAEVLDQVPCTTVVDDGQLDVLDVLAEADLVALDTETVFDPENPTDLDVDGPGALRVVSIAARTPDGVVSFVLDMAYVTPDALQRKLRRLALARLRRACVSGVELPDPVGELLQLGDLDAEDALEVASGDLKAVLPDALTVSGAEVVVWNAAFDRKVLRRDGIDAWNMRDAMLYRAVLDLGRAGVRFYSPLARVVRELLGLELDGKGSTQLSYREPEVQPTLSDVQVRYAAFDAVTTLLVFERLRAEVAACGLEETVELEVQAQPFITGLTEHGLPLDVDGWNRHLADADRERSEVEAELAGLTGGSGDLFGGVSLDWSPSKDADIRRVLNEHSGDLVSAYMVRKEGAARLLGRNDQVDKTALRQIGGPVAGAILRWKALEKIRSTYGSELVELADEAGRLHPKYLQAVVATGRLASSKPNAQNLSPQMKPFIRPPSGRVFVYADLGQAELRMLAQVSADAVLRQAFYDGADIHTRTAEGMFKVDVQALMDAGRLPDDRLVLLASELVGRRLISLEGADGGTDGDGVAMLDVGGVRVSRDGLVEVLTGYARGLRARGKTLNFGVCYGLRANSLATQLSVAGVQTDRREAQRLLSLYDEAYPGVAGWLRDRDEFIARLAASPPKVDFARSLALYEWHPRVSKLERRLAKELGHRPSSGELAAALFEGTAAGQAAGQVEVLSGAGAVPSGTLPDLSSEDGRVAWVQEVRGHLTPVLLGPDGSAVAFESRTPGGRRRLFNIHASAWVKEMVQIAVKSQKPVPLALRHRFEQERKVTLSDAKSPERTVPFADMRRRLTDTVCQEYFSMLRQEMPDGIGFLMGQAVSEAIKALGNQYRNAPIQGGVADAALWAYAAIQKQLDAYFPSAHGVQTVHDSITIECDVSDAVAVGRMLERLMVDGLARYTPDVPAVADMKILSCLDERTGAVDLSELPAG